VSEDGLTLTIILLFNDSWEETALSDRTPEEQAISNLVQQYAVDNGITYTFNIENI
jgi:hypothetical protein